MNIEQIREYCLSKKAVTESFPFDGDTLVFKVAGKIFALISISERPLKINLKMNPEIINEWREQYEDVQPGFHMNKSHWNTVTTGNSLTAEKILWMIDHSYAEVVSKLTRKTKSDFGL